MLRLASLLLLGLASNALRKEDMLEDALTTQEILVNESGLSVDSSSSLLESDFVASAKVRRLSEEEYHEYSVKRGLAPAEAERIFHGHLLRAISLAQARARAGDLQNGTGDATDPGHITEKGEDYEFWTGQRADLKAAMDATDSNFQREQFKRLLASELPLVQIYFCIQINVDLSLIPPHVPMLQMNFGLLGSIYVSSSTGCWGGILEVGLGLDWGVKVFGFSLGVGASVTGTLDFSEVPPSRATQDPESIRRDAVLYAPEGADLTKCHSKSPWPLLQTFWEEQVKKVFRSKEVEDKVQEEIKLHEEEVVGFKRVYASLIGTDSFGQSGPLGAGARHFVVTRSSTKNSYRALNVPTLVAPAVAMLVNVQHFADVLPSYAAQVMDRLADNQRNEKGNDNERTRIWPQVWRRFHNSRGRFLARWPSAGALSAFDEDLGKDAHLAKSFSGDVLNRGTDMRVINFAKVMRISRWKEEPFFWKELAMSASNLAIRVVSDVKALFATFLAGDPHWDGACEALPASFYSAGIDKAMLQKMQTYPWVSRHTSVSKRLEFARAVGKLGKDLNVLDSRPQDATRRVFPHLWCGLAEEAFEKSKPAMLAALLNNSRRVLEVSVAQACETVTHELHDLTPDDEITWDNEAGHYAVKRGQKDIGFLYGEGPTWFGSVPQASSVSGLVYMASKGSKVASKVVESHPECERAHLPASFVQLFPQFSHAAAELAAQMEEILFDINFCLGEVLSFGEEMARSAASALLRPLRSKDEAKALCAGFNKAQKLGFVRKRAIDAVRVVRYMLLKLGAGDPREHYRYQDGDLPVSDEEELFIRVQPMKVAAGEATPAPLSTSIVEDFRLGLGVESRTVRSNEGFIVGERVRVGPDQALGTLTAVSPDGNEGMVDVVLDGDFAAQSFGIASVKSLYGGVSYTRIAMPLSGHLWQGVASLGSRVMQHVELSRRLVQEKRRLRSPVEFTNALSFTFQLAKNSFCTPNTGLIMVSHVRKHVWQTWSKRVFREKCWIGRIRPGSAFVQVNRCVGDNGGQGGDFGAYTDWRVRYQATLASSKSGGSGALLSGFKGTFAETLVEAGAHLGAFAPGVLDRIYPRLHNSNILTGLIMAGTASAPLMGVVGAAAATSGELGFRAVCKRFLESLEKNGIVDPAEKASGWGASTKIVVRGTVVHREKNIKLISGPEALGVEGSHDPKIVTKHQRFISVHVANWNFIASPEVVIPGGLSAEIHARLDLDWDLTPWIEWRLNRERFLQNRARVKICAACLMEKKAFCDWFLPLGTLWQPEFDICVPDTEEESNKCARETGAIDDDGWPLSATFYSPKGSRGVAACDGIDFVRANKELKISGALRRFLRRR